MHKNGRGPAPLAEAIVCMQSVLPFAPLPSPAYAAAEASLLRRGFVPDAILQHYRFSVDENASALTNAVAFADPIKRTPADYAAFSIYNDPTGQGNPGIVELLARTGAPFHLLHREHRFDFWITTLDAEQQAPRAHLVESDISYDRLGNMLDQFGGDLSPGRIVGVKQGREQFRHAIFADLQPLQLALWAVEATGPALRLHFAHAVNQLRESFHPETPATDEEITRLAIRLLGAMVLADTGALGRSVRLDRDDISVDTLMAHAADKFDRYFSQIPESQLEAAQAAHEVLRRVSYAGFSPHMLIDLYTEAYTKSQRRKLGRFDTPLFLTRRIWNALPVEFLPPAQRVACDMTAGWGSFLIAAHERLDRLHDMQGRPLRKYIHGNDIEPLASRLAGLGLLLSTLEDSWHVDNEDALTWRWIEEKQPHIIVGNPPFHGDRKRPKKGEGGEHDAERSSVRRKRTQKADAFLIRAIDCLAPGGLLGMVMPRSFVVAEASPHLRAKLLSQCDILEIWELPQQVFRDASVESSVVFARKHPAPRGRSFAPVMARTVQPQNFEAFRDEDRFTRSVLVPSQGTWMHERSPTRPSNTHLMQYSLVLPASEWQKLRARCVDLSERAVLFTGLARGTPSKRKPQQTDKDSRDVSYLPKADLALPGAFRVSYASAETRRYPDDFERPRQSRDHILSGEKVIFTSVGNPSWGPRVKVAIERQGAFVSDGFWVAVPTEEGRVLNINLEVLAAVIGWVVSNAWIVDQMRAPKLLRDAVQTIPFPAAITAEACEEITRAVRQIEQGPSIMTFEEQEENPHATINRVLSGAYGLDSETFEWLRTVAMWNDEPREPVDPPVNREAVWRVDGNVESVNREDGLVTLRLTGFSGPQRVSISPQMPAWLLRPGTAFRTTVTRAARETQRISGPTDLGTFTVMPYAYMDEEEVLAALGEALHAG